MKWDHWEIHQYARILPLTLYISHPKFLPPFQKFPFTDIHRISSIRKVLLRWHCSFYNIPFLTMDRRVERLNLFDIVINSFRFWVWMHWPFESKSFLFCRLLLVFLHESIWNFLESMYIKMEFVCIFKISFKIWSKYYWFSSVRKFLFGKL